MSNAKEAIQLLESGVQEMFNSEKYKDYLKFYSRLHNYSFNNCILIYSQFPTATAVASYRTWKSMKINVKKGEKGIKVLVPIPYKKETKDGEEEEHLWFKVGNVFDISQTDGELPKLGKELMEDSEMLDQLVERLIIESHGTISYDFSLTGETTNGYCNSEGIKLRPGMSSLQTFKTLMHEKAHSILHVGKQIDRKTAELEAESTAFVVCSMMGFNTEEYSFGYVVGWAQDKSVIELHKSLTVIEKTSREILDWVEAAEKAA